MTPSLTHAINELLRSWVHYKVSYKCPINLTLIDTGLFEHFQNYWPQTARAGSNSDSCPNVIVLALTFRQLSCKAIFSVTNHTMHGGECGLVFRGHTEDSLTTTIYVSVPTPTLRTTSTAYRQSLKWFVSAILTEGFIETLGTGVYFQWMASLKIPINILFSVIH